jgi:hypothetical protein
VQKLESGSGNPECSQQLTDVACELQYHFCLYQASAPCLKVLTRDRSKANFEVHHEFGSRCGRLHHGAMQFPYEFCLQALQKRSCPTSQRQSIPDRCVDRQAPSWQHTGRSPLVQRPPPPQASTPSSRVAAHPCARAGGARTHAYVTDDSYVGTMYLMLMNASSPPRCSKSASVSVMSSPRQSYSFCE